MSASYWKLWAASTISNLGDGIFLVGLPLLAARQTRSATAISLISVAAALPWLILSLPVGALVDRGDRRRLMVRADLVRAAAVGVLAILAATGNVEIWMLWAAAALLGIAEVFFDNAAQAILPSIVEPELLERANGRRYSAEMAANTFIGTPIGGILFAAAIWLPFATDAGSFLVAALLVLSLRGSFRPADATSTTNTNTATNTATNTQAPTMRDDIGEGLRWLWNHHLLRGIAMALGLSNLGFQMSQAVFVLFAQDELGVGERWFGVLLGLMGLGAIIGGLLGARIVRWLGTSAAMYTAMVVWIVSLITIAAFPHTWVVAVVSMIEAVAVTVWNVVTVSLRQRIVPDRLFGRVNSVYRWFGWGTIPIGALLGGQIARLYGLRATYVAGAALVFVALLVLASVLRGSGVSAAEGIGASPPPCTD